MSQQCLFLFHQLLHLPDKPVLYLGDLVDLLHRGSLAKRLIHDKVAFAGRRDQHLEQLFPAFGMKIFGKAQTVASGLQAADGLLEGFFIGLADAHHFTHGTHLGAQLVLHALEFFKGPAGKLDDHIISVRHIFVQSAVFAAGNIL